MSRPKRTVPLRPERIRILGKRFAVAFVPSGDPGLRDSPEDNEPGVGRCDPDRQQIWIEAGQPIESEQDAVLHEIIHCLEHAMNVEAGEEVVRGLATGLLAVIKDNPRLITYLRSDGLA